MTPQVGAIAALWPSDSPAADSTVRRFLAFPSQHDPRLLIPTRPHRASVIALRALRDKSTLTARAKTELARAAIAVTRRAVELPDPDILGTVLSHLREDDYTYGVHFGPPRANRKPVIAIVTTGGNLTAFAKCGVDELTDRLVRREAQALGLLNGLTSITVPVHLGSGDFDGHAYLVQSPVPASSVGQAKSSAVVAAQVEVAGVGRESVDVAVALHATARLWDGRVASSPNSSAKAQLRALADEWARAARGADLLWGSWHGDWRATNMAVNGSMCSVWDWERFATGVPAGYDALHLFLTSQVSSTIEGLPAQLYANADRLLQPFGVHPGATAELVATGYLLELAGRYLDDDQTRAGARLGQVEEWLLPHLVRVASQRTSRSQGRDVNES